MLDSLYHDSVYHDTHHFFIRYLVYRAEVARASNCRFGRIRRAAVALCEMAGDTGRDALVETLRSLCFLSFRSQHTWFRNMNGHRESPSKPAVPSSDDLEVDLCVAAIHLGRYAHVEQLITKGWEFCDWDPKVQSDVWSDVFGSAFVAATLRGDVSMIRLLLSSNPHYNPSEPVPYGLRDRILTNAAWYCHGEAFDFAIDSGPLGVNKGNIEICKYTPYHFLSQEYALVSRGVGATSIVDNYRRGVAMLLPHNPAGHKNFNDNLENQLSFHSFKGHIDMVRYLLDSEPSQQVKSESINSPLLAAVQGGQRDIASLLLQHGAEADQCSLFDSPLQHAAKASSTSLARLLLEAGADTNVGQPPPIVLAVAKEDADMFRLLCDHGATLDTPESGGWAMAVAQFWGFESMIDMLVEKGMEKDVVLQRCPERQEIAELPWYLFLEKKEHNKDDELLDLLEISWWSDEVSDS
ncbi:ankyrin repeat-containing domain protein [Nemania sp. FL0031]|nr:ankyrin repeat-containing domain protein [Nemania sp. FL0031]